MSFTAGKSACKNLNGRLAAFKTKDELATLKFHRGLDRQDTTHDVMVGLDGAVNECFNGGCDNQLTWSDATSFVFDSSFMPQIQGPGTKACHYCIKIQKGS